MRKIIAIIVMFFIMISWTFASTETEQKETLIIKKIEKLIAKKWEKNRYKYIDQLTKLREKTKWNTNEILRNIIRTLYKNTKTIYLDWMTCNIWNYSKISEAELIKWNYSKKFNDSKVIWFHLDCTILKDIDISKSLLFSINDVWLDYNNSTIYSNIEWLDKNSNFFINDNIKKWFSFWKYKNWEGFSWSILSEIPNNVENILFHLRIINNWQVNLWKWAKMIIWIPKNEESKVKWLNNLAVLSNYYFEENKQSKDKFILKSKKWIFYYIESNDEDIIWNNIEDYLFRWKLWANKIIEEKILLEYNSEKYYPLLIKDDWKTKILFDVPEDIDIKKIVLILNDKKINLTDLNYNSTITNNNFSLYENNFSCLNYIWQFLDIKKYTLNDCSLFNKWIVYEWMDSILFYWLIDSLGYIKKIDTSNLGDYYCKENNYSKECLWISNWKVNNITKYYY